jgi:hypothetical protein
MRDPRTKPYRQRFAKLARKMLLELGAEPRPLAAYECIDGPAVDLHEMLLDTPGGTLFLNPYDSWIAARFVDPRHANRLVDCNPHSGKWNFHEWQSGKPDLAIAAIRGQLECLLRAQAKRNAA